MTTANDQPLSARHQSVPATRRQILAGTGTTVAGIAFTGSFSELFVGTAAARGHSGYGPLVPDPDALLDLPRGFHYRVLSREGDPLRSGEGSVPSNHDGMAALRGRRGRVHLVRNHENRHDGRIGVPTVDGLTYDPAAKGGCTTITLDGRGNVLDERVAVAGTAVNCAGGPTPGAPGSPARRTRTRPAPTATPRTTATSSRSTVPTRSAPEPYR